MLVVHGRVGREETFKFALLQNKFATTSGRTTGAADKRALIADQRDVGDQTLIPLLPASYPFVMLPIPLLNEESSWYTSVHGRYLSSS